VLTNQLTMTSGADADASRPSVILTVTVTVRVSRGGGAGKPIPLFTVTRPPAGTALADKPTSPLGRTLRATVNAQRRSSAVQNTRDGQLLPGRHH
jgi:hypothetical protein